jgi:hypothetical protein
VLAVGEVGGGSRPMEPGIRGEGRGERFPGSLNLFSPLFPSPTYTSLRAW